MQKRKLGKSNLEVSAIGLGGMGLNSSVSKDSGIALMVGHAMVIDGGQTVQ